MMTWNRWLGGWDGVVEQTWATLNFIDTLGIKVMMAGLVAASRARTLMKTEHTNVDCATGCMPIVPMNIQE